MLKDILNQFKPAPQPEPSPAPTPAATPEARPETDPKPIDQSPQALAERAAEAAGFVVNERYYGTTTKHKPTNKHLIWCLMDNWGEPVLFSVNDQADWSAAETIYGFYVKPNGQGVLQFENRDGIRRNKWRARR